MRTIFEELNIFGNRETKSTNRKIEKPTKVTSMIKDRVNLDKEVKIPKINFDKYNNSEMKFKIRRYKLFSVD